MRHALVAALPLLCLSCSGSNAEKAPQKERLVSSRTYKGHANEADLNNLVNAYPATLGTRLDDCQTCHRGGRFTAHEGGSARAYTKSACDYCHLVLHPDSTFIEPQPTSYAETLNSYGTHYLAKGRNEQALRALDGVDSDGDGAGNGAEIADLKYPGDPDSKPGQPNAPQRLFTMEQLRQLTAHSQLQLCNSTKQPYDDYASFTGVTLRELIVAAGGSPDDPAIIGVTVITPDGFTKDFPIGALNAPYPAGLFFAGLDAETLGPTCGFVRYPRGLTEGLVDGGPIPGEQWLMLAYQRDGLPMEPCALDPASGRINGEGPLRLVVPQSKSGKPDRAMQLSPTGCNDGLDYDRSKDHNASAMVRGAVAIRINPLPDGYEDFDFKNGGWAFIAGKSLIVYGYGIR